MNIEIPYAGEKVGVEVENEKLNATLHPNEVVKKDEERVIKKALDAPIDKPRFSEFIDDGTLIIVNDATRPTPTSLVLSTVQEEIEEHEVELIVATGSHRPPTDEEFEWIFGDLYEKFKERIHVHRAKSDEMLHYGTTERGTPIKFNSLISDAKKIVAINTVEPHYFAGFTGGRKSFLPGVASYETITENHYHTLKKEARTLKLEGNPVNEDMMEAYRKFSEIFEGEVFSLNITLDKDGDVHSASSGDIERSFYEEVQASKDIFSVEIEEKSEVVLTAAHPMDLDLYQSHKAVEFAKLALKEGGIIILVSGCLDGIGPRNFYDLMSSVESPEEISEVVEEDYELGYQKGVKMQKLCSERSLWAVTELEDEILKDIFIEPKISVQQALDEAISETGGKVTIIPEGGITVPTIS